MRWIRILFDIADSDMLFVVLMLRENPEPQNQVTYCVACIAPENPNMMHTRMGAINTEKYLVLGWETVGIQDPVSTQSKVMNNDMQYAFATALVDQLEDYGANVNKHHRRLRTRQYSARPQIEAKTSQEIQSE